MKTLARICIALVTLTASIHAQGIEKRVLLLRDGSKVNVANHALKPTKLSDIKFKTDLSNLTPVESKGIEDKRALKGFNRPQAIWRVKGGYLAYYDGGEFGAALFHFSSDGSRRFLVLADYVEEIAPLTEGGFLIAGGFRDYGAVHIITKNDKHRWGSKLLMISLMGVPTLEGRLPNKNFIVSNLRLGTYTELRIDGWMRQRWDIQKFDGSGDPFPE